MSRTARSFAVCFLAIPFILSTRPAEAERASAPELFPVETVAYFRIPDAQELIRRFNETALGRVAQDEQIRPLIAQLYGSAAEAFTEIEDEAGASLEEILKLPQGEVALAVVALPERRPGVVILMDVAEDKESIEKLRGRVDKLMEQLNARTSTETIEGIEVSVAADPNRQERQLAHFVRDNTFVATTDLELARTVLTRWETAGEESLAKNKKFGAIIQRCAGGKNDSPQIVWFVDPIEVARAATQGNIGGRAGLAFLPVIGLDGLSGVGGTVELASKKFDMITHMHVLIENPRTGVMDMIALEPGETTPENWVPADVTNYVTLHWNMAKTYNGAATLFDSFRGEGAMSSLMKRRFTEMVGLDFEEELLPAMDGRISYAQWFERPIRPGSEATVLGIKLDDGDAFRGTMDKAVEKYENFLNEEQYAGVTYFKFTPRGATDRPRRPDAEETDDADDARRNARREARQRQRPCMAIVGDYLIVTNRPTTMEKLIVSSNDSDQSLAKQLDFKLVTSKFRRHSAGHEPAMITFQRPEERMKALYDMVTAEESRSWIAERSDRNRFFQTVNDALDENPLPPFSVISQYMAPGGGLLTNEETGFHYTGFILRREPAP